MAAICPSSLTRRTVVSRSLSACPVTSPADRRKSWMPVSGIEHFYLGDRFLRALLRDEAIQIADADANFVTARLRRLA